MENLDNKNFDDFARKALNKTPQVPKELGLDWDSMDFQMPSENDENSDQQNTFEKFVKKELIETPQIPTDLELEWDNMSIQLPEPKKKRRVFYLIFLSLILGLIILGVICYVDQSKVTGINEGVVQNSTKVDLHSASDVPSISEIKNQKIPEVIERRVVQAENNSVTRDIVISDRNVDFSDSNNVSPIDISNILITNDLLVGNSESILRSEIVLESADDQNQRNFKAFGIRNENPSKRIRALELALARKLYLEYEQIEFIKAKTKLLSLPEEQEHANNNSSIYILGGNNLSSLQFNENKLLENKLQPKLGLSFQAGIRKELDHYLGLQLGVTYDEYHTTFTHTRVLSRSSIPNENADLVICEHIYINNYSKYIGLTFGVDKDIPVGQRFAFRTSFSLVGNVQIGREGLTLLDNQITDISELDHPSRISLNINPSVALIYKFSDLISLQSSYGYSTNLFNPIQINKNVTSNGQHNFMMGLGYDF